MLNPKTGAVYVMASSPTYNPNKIESNTGYAQILHTPSACPGSSSALLNRATQGLYPPGSTFKTVTAGAALDAHIYTPDLAVLRPGLLRRVRQEGARTRSTPTRTAPRPTATSTCSRPTSTRSTRSSATSARRSAPALILDKAKDFGFYSKPPIELPSDEVAPSGLYNLTKHSLYDNPALVDPGRLAFGQEHLLTTPLQMALVAAGVANNGTVMTPHLVKEVLTPSGSVVTHDQAEGLAAGAEAVDRRRAQPDDAGEVVRAAPAPAAQIPGVKVAGKTGTAETSVHRVYDAWFIFFAPADNPHGGRRSRRRAPAERLRRLDRGANREAAHAGDPSRDVERISRTPMSNPDPLIDRVFDRRYVIKRKLGSGGMADVYLAEDQELGRNVALKLLNERHAADEQFVERFRREAQSAAGLNHPNIVSIFDRGLRGGHVLHRDGVPRGPHAEGAARPQRADADPASRSSTRARSWARSPFAHRNGIVHRDIKPHNIVVGSDGRLKVTDFGIARSGASQMTEAGSIVGTAQYLSPEQARGAPVDPRSDLYSLGIVLYEMLTGHVPFTGDTPVEIAMKHLSLAPGAAVGAPARGAAQPRRAS